MNSRWQLQPTVQSAECRVARQHKLGLLAVPGNLLMRGGLGGNRSYDQDRKIYYFLVCISMPISSRVSVAPSLCGSSTWGLLIRGHDC